MCEMDSITRASFLEGALPASIDFNEKEREHLNKTISVYAGYRAMLDFLRESEVKTKGGIKVSEGRGMKFVYVIYRIGNAVKKIFGKSDWQILKGTMTDKVITFLNNDKKFCEFSLKNKKILLAEFSKKIDPIIKIFVEERRRSFGEKQSEMIFQRKIFAVLAENILDS